MLVLVREFDDRFGYAKWTFKSCAEWLAWRCGISLSARARRCARRRRCARCRKSRAAFADGRLSYSKVRALTRVAHVHDEDLLLAYALQATAAQVEERCRHIRNVTPESAHDARRAWEQRSLTVWRNEASGTLRITVELPIEDGELIARAIDCAVAAGEVTTGVEPDADRSSRRARLARAASRCAGRDREDVSRWRRCRRQRIDGRSLPSRRARGRKIPPRRDRPRRPADRHCQASDAATAAS